MNLVNPQAALPRLLQIRGLVMGTSIRVPLMPEVCIATSESHISTLIATTRLVEQAIALRGRPIRAMTVLDRCPRLLWIRDDTEMAAMPQLSEQQRTEHLFTRWDEVLRRLAR